MGLELQHLAKCPRFLHRFSLTYLAGQDFLWPALVLAIGLVMWATTLIIISSNRLDGESGLVFDLDDARALVVRLKFLEWADMFAHFLLSRARLKVSSRSAFALISCCWTSWPSDEDTTSVETFKRCHADICVWEGVVEPLLAFIAERKKLSWL